jgi:hypothetical protein
MGAGRDKAKPDLDTPTRRIAERLLNTPPKPHDQMKLGKLKPAKQTKRLRDSSFLFDGKSVEALKHALKGLCDRGFNGRLINCSLHISKPIERCPARLAGDNFIVGWATQIDEDGRSALVAFDADFKIVVAHS